LIIFYHKYTKKIFFKDDMELGTRYEEWKYPKGYNVIAEWSDLSSCRVFVVYELENAEAYMDATFP
jgi:hypothetical protein